MAALTPQRILEVGMGFWPAKVLLSAVEVGVFSALGTSAKTAEELRTELGLHPRAMPDFPGCARRTRVPRAGGERSDGTLSQHGGDRRLPRPAKPALRRGLPRDGKRAPLPVLG